MIFLSNIEKETHWINWGYSGVTCESYEDNLEIKKLEPNLKLVQRWRIKLIKKKPNFYFRKTQENLSSPTKLLKQVMYVIEFIKFFISKIIFYLIDLHNNKANMIFSNDIFFIKKTNTWQTCDRDGKSKSLITKDKTSFFF